MTKQIKLKSLLKEGFAWERKAGKPLPTIQEVMDEYEAKKETKEPIEETDISPEYDKSLLGTEIVKAAEEYARGKAQNSMMEISLAKAFIAGILWKTKK